MNTRILVCAMVVLLVGCAAPTPADETTISFVWSYRAGDYVRGVPTVHDRVVYAGVRFMAAQVEAQVGQ